MAYPNDAEWSVSRVDEIPVYQTESMTGFLRRRNKTGFYAVQLTRSWTFRADNQTKADAIITHYKANSANSFSVDTRWDNAGVTFANCWYQGGVQSTRNRFNEITFTVNIIAIESVA